jgi:hypothetical protein
MRCGDEAEFVCIAIGSLPPHMAANAMLAKAVVAN